MLHKLFKPLILLIFISTAGSIGYKVYCYYTHNEPPHIILSGLTEQGHYKESIQGQIEAKNAYKIGTITALLDGKLFNGIQQKINRKSFTIPFSIDSTQLEDGSHTMQIAVEDTSKNHNTSTIKVSFYVDNKGLTAAFTERSYRADQGKTAHLKIQTNKPVKSIIVNVLNQQYQCFQEAAQSTLYECFIPIDCEEKVGEHLVIAEVSDYVGNVTKLANKLDVMHFSFPQQKGFSVNAEKLEAEKEISMNNNVLDEAIKKWLTESPKHKLWHGPFELPLQVRRMTTPFGELRMTPERGRYHHKGVDLVNMPKSVVWAAQHGKVIIKDRFTMTGNTIVLDHGCGVMTLYAHLDSFADIDIGDMVKKGNPIGRVGMTGYAAGYHLHWELRVNNTPVDPMEWTKTIF